MHFWCSFKTAPKLHQKCIMFFEHFQQNFEENSAARTSQVSLPVHLSWLLTCKYFEFHNSSLYSYCLIQYIFLGFSHVSTLSCTIPPYKVTVWFWHSSSWKFTGISSTTSFLTSHMQVFSVSQFLLINAVWSHYSSLNAMVVKITCKTYIRWESLFELFKLGTKWNKDTDDAWINSPCFSLGKNSPNWEERLLKFKAWLWTLWKNRMNTENDHHRLWRSTRSSIIFTLDMAS